VIKSELTPNNLLNVYSMAYTLRITRLVKELEQYMIKEGNILQADNSVQYLLEGLRFESKALVERSKELLTASFNSVATRLLASQASAADGKGENLLVNLPFETLLDLLKVD
jgi:hypothetical protein